MSNTLVFTNMSSHGPSFWVYDANGHACSKGCDAGYSMDDDGFWRCMHGQWRVIDEIPSANRPHHPNVCPGNCPYHPLLNKMIRDFYRAEDAGIFWGDLILEWDRAALAAETPAQRSARLDAEAREERRRQAEMKRSEELKVESVIAAMPKIPERAKWNHPTHRHGLKPCRYFNACSCDRPECRLNGCNGKWAKEPLKTCKNVMGKAAPAQKDPKSGMWWPAGCAPHLKGKCEFFHPDEPEWAMIVAQKDAQIQNSGGRDFSALSSGRSNTNTNSSSSSHRY